VKPPPPEPPEPPRTEPTKQWLLENQDAFEAYARFVELHPIFNEIERDW
jgi:post-segregation antitoxin (ccd killing protein)